MKYLALLLLSFILVSNALSESVGAPPGPKKEAVAPASKAKSPKRGPASIKKAKKSKKGQKRKG